MENNISEWLLPSTKGFVTTVLTGSEAGTPDFQLWQWNYCTLFFQSKLNPLIIIISNALCQWYGNRASHYTLLKELKNDTTATTCCHCLAVEEDVNAQGLRKMPTSKRYEGSKRYHHSHAGFKAPGMLNDSRKEQIHPCSSHFKHDKNYFGPRGFHLDLYPAKTVLFKSEANSSHISPGMG